MKRITSVLLALLLVIVAINPVTANAAIKVTPTSKTIYVGDSFNIKVTGTSKTVKYSSSDKSVASVTSKGKVTGKKAGTAKITVKIGTTKKTCKVTVKKLPSFNVNQAAKYTTYEAECAFDEYGNTCALMVVTNDYWYSYCVTYNCVYYDSMDNEVYKTSRSISVLPKKSELIVTFPSCPAMYNAVKFETSYVITKPLNLYVDVFGKYYGDTSEYFFVEYEKSYDDNYDFVATVENPTSKDLFIYYSYVVYDSEFTHLIDSATSGVMIPAGDTKELYIGTFTGDSRGQFQIISAYYSK